MINRRELLMLASLGLLEGCAAKAGKRVNAVDHELRLLAGVPRPEYLSLPTDKPQVYRSKGDFVMSEMFPHKGGGQTQVKVRFPYRVKLPEELKVPSFRELVKADMMESNYPHLQIDSIRNPHYAVISLIGHDKESVGSVNRIKLRAKRNVGLFTEGYKNSEFYNCESNKDSDICRMINPEDGEAGYVEQRGNLTYTRPAKGNNRNNLLKLFQAVKEFYEPRLAVLMVQEGGVVIGEQKTTPADVKRLDEILYLATRV